MPPSYNLTCFFAKVGQILQITSRSSLSAASISSASKFENQIELCLQKSSIEFQLTVALFHVERFTNQGEQRRCKMNLSFFIDRHIHSDKTLVVL